MGFLNKEFEARKILKVGDKILGWHNSMWDLFLVKEIYRLGKSVESVGWNMIDNIGMSGESLYCIKPYWGADFDIPMMSVPFTSDIIKRID